MPSTYQKPLKALRPLHFEIIKLYLRFEKQYEIAKKLGVSETTISHTLKDPLARKIIHSKLDQSLIIK